MERQLALLAESLPATWVVRVVSLSDGVFADVLRGADIELTILPRAFRFDIRPAAPLGKLIREWQPTIVHTYGWISTAAALRSCRAQGIPLVDASIQEGRAPSRRGNVMRMTVSAADIVIANSQAGLDAFGIDAERGRVVYNGFDPARWALCGDGKRAAGGPTTVVMTARMHRHKDYRTLLDAARALGAENPGEWRFVAIGSGDDRPGLMSDYRDLIGTGVADFPEPRQEVLGLVGESAIGVLLTNAAFAAEGISNSIMEYMACGLPVVCTDSGGNRELVLEGQTGMLVAPGDVNGVIEQLRFLRDNPADATRMGLAGRERIATVFSLDELVAGTLAAYELALERKRAHRPGHVRD
jgi:glycosyltransferase involved in cell wall biosynthesis